ncbi:MAG: tetratricopeptide repeat protein [Planctomycetes bacterium]|nr:tetratricopeptide repeat protein [Planctomycetota bacterium]
MDDLALLETLLSRAGRPSEAMDRGLRRHAVARALGRAEDLGAALVAEGVLSADDLRRIHEAEPPPAPSADGVGWTTLLAVQGSGSRDDESPRLGRSFGPYEVLERVAAGGMGVVYKARHRELDRVVALKVLRHAEDASEVEVERFRNEARAAAQLDHPGIVAVHDIGEVEGRLYFTMDFVEGETLTAIMKRVFFRPEESCRVVREVALAVGHAHGRGIVHRDLKPSNILIDPSGRPLVTDFGLAKDLGHARGLTQTDAIVGTVDYMSPEQAAGASRQADARSDVYSLGVILYEMTTGRLPFDADSTMEVLRKIVLEEPPPPRRLRPEVPLDVQTICLKALEKVPAARYPDASRLAEDLGRYLEGEPIEARPVSWPERVRRKVRRHGAVTLTSTGAALVIALVVGLYLQRTAAARATEARSLLVEGRQALEGGDPATALGLLDQAVALVPGSAELRLARARARLAAARPMEALEDLERAVSLEPHSVVAALERAGALKIAGRWHEALAELDRAVGLGEQGTEALRERARLRRAGGDRTGALADLDLAVGRSPRDPRLRSERAALRVEEGDPAGALADLDLALEISPGDPGLRLGRAEALAASGDTPGALGELNLVLERDPDYAPAVTRRARLAFAAGQFRQVVHDCTRLLVRRPRDGEALLWRGRAQTALGLPLEAARDFQAASEAVDPGDPAEALADLGVLHAVGERPSDAQAAFTAALALAPGHETARRNRARLFLLQGRTAEAAADLERLPAGDLAVSLLAARLAAREDPARALALLDSAAATHPSDPRPRALRAALRRAVALADPAAGEDARAALALRPSEASRPWVERAEAALKERSHARARFFLALALWEDPDDAPALVRRAQVWRMEGNPDRAAADLEEALRLNPACVEAWSERGWAAYRDERFAEALADFGSALALDPGRPELHEALGYARWRLKDEAGAREAFREALRLAPESAGALAGLGLVEYGAEDLPAAKRLFLKAVGLDPASYLAHHGLGLVALRAGNPREAVDHLSRAIAVEPGYAPAYRARARAWRALGEEEAARRDEARSSLGEEFYRKGRLLYDHREWGRAIEFFTRAIEAEPTHPLYWSMRAKAYQKTTRIHLALVDHMKAAELDPDRADELLQFQDAFNEYEGVLAAGPFFALVESALADRPDDAASAFTRGFLHCYLVLRGRATPDQERSALAYLDLAVDRNPRFAAALLYRSLVRSHRGEDASAREDLARAREVAPGTWCAGYAWYREAMLAAGQGDAAAAAKAMEGALATSPRWEGQLHEWASKEPAFDPVRSDPAFARAMTR